MRTPEPTEQELKLREAMHALRVLRMTLRATRLLYEAEEMGEMPDDLKALADRLHADIKRARWGRAA